MPSTQKTKMYKNKSAQDIQDDIFRRMPIGKKIKLMSDFFSFARDLNPKGILYGTRKIAQKNRRYSA